MAVKGVTLTYSFGSLVLDAAPAQDHAVEVDVTDHPVETGASVTDHARPKPRTLRIDGMFESVDPYTTLWFLARERVLVRVDTLIETYENMLITSLRAPRDASTGEALRFSATFRQIVFAESQRVTVRLPAAKVNRGNQPSKDASADTKAKVNAPSKSVAKTAADAIGGAALSLARTLRGGR